MPTASVPLNRASVRGSSTPTWTVATSPSRITRPPRLAIDDLREFLRGSDPAGQPDRPLVVDADQSANRDGQILRRDGADHLTHADVRRLERIRPHVDRHLARVGPGDVDLADARNRPQRSRDAGSARIVS